MTRVWAAAVVVVSLGVQSGASGANAGAQGRRDDGPHVATAGQLIISEFRTAGVGGVNDEFIELYNASGADHTVAAASGSGYGVAASDGVTRCTIPNGTLIPARGHYLCVNSAGYSLGSYPAGTGTATGDQTYTIDIPSNAGIAIFNNNAGGLSYSLANRLDAAGATTEANATYREGAGYPAPTPALLDVNNYAITRKVAGGCTGSSGGGNCGSVLLMQTTPPVASGAPVDTNDNAGDFMFVDPSGTALGFGQRLGAPGPENLSAPIAGGPTTIGSSRFDTCAAPLAAPNQVRDLTAGPDATSSFGTIELRRRWTNNSGVNITRLRFRVVDISTFPSLPGVADLRPLTSPDASVVVDRPPCGSGTSSVTVRGTALEGPPSQPSGGGYRSSLATSISLATPLANGASIDVRFVLGVDRVGIGRFCVVPETLPVSGGELFCFIGHTDSSITAAAGDFDFDQLADMPLYNAFTGQWNVLRSAGGFVSSTTIAWGGPNYRPVPGDYDGDGRLDAALYEEPTGTWSVLTSSSNYTRTFTAAWGGYGYIAVPGDYDGDGIADIAVYSASTSNWYVRTSSTSYGSSFTKSWGGTGYTPIGGQDFDGDRKSDLVVFQQTTGTWHVLQSSTGFTTATTAVLGGPGSTLVPGDYDADGLADFAVYNRTSTMWTVRKSTAGYAQSNLAPWGGRGFVVFTGDFDGDHKIDLGLYQPLVRDWFIAKSSTGYMSTISATFGSTSDTLITDAVTPAASRAVHAGDFDGDIRSDMTVYNPTTGFWSILKSGSGFTTASTVGWGGAGYEPAPGDYDGDGKGDLGLYQPSTGVWFVLLSSTGFTTSFSRSCGGPGYVAVPGDYDGDAKTDFVVYNTTTGLWFGLKSTGAYTTTINVSWGGTGYTAAPADFDGDGLLDLPVYQGATGTWSILTSSSGYASAVSRNYGGAGYTPVPADYDGDGFAEFAVYHVATGAWSILKSSSSYLASTGLTWGGVGSTPVTGDWDGDGRVDLGAYTPAGIWSILLSGSNNILSMSKSWGGPGYAPTPVYP